MSPRDTQNSYYMRASGLANAYKIAVNIDKPLRRRKANARAAPSNESVFSRKSFLSSAHNTL
jgi:hypothetical protein